MEMRQTKKVSLKHFFFQIVYNALFNELLN